MNLPDTIDADIASTAVVIPAYNAAKHLSDVLARVTRIVPAKQVIVVDDGSQDQTQEVLAASPATIIHHDVNRGKGAALCTGIDKANEMGMQFAITLDADGQHDPSEISDFIKRQNETHADIVVGNRMEDKRDMPPLRVFANRATSAFVSWRARTRIPDSQNGYRLIRVVTFLSFKIETFRYDTESEMLIKAGRRGAKIASVGTRTIYGDEVSSVNPFVDTIRFLKMVGRSLFW